MLGQLNLLAEDSLANLTVLPGSEKARKMTVTSGQKCLGSSKKSNPIGLLEKMLLTSSTWSSTAHLLTWKASTTPQGRLLFLLRPLGGRIDGIGFSLLPTPIARDGRDFSNPTPTQYRTVKTRQSPSCALILTTTWGY